jgi:hypothetical protein
LVVETKTTSELALGSPVTDPLMPNTFDETSAVTSPLGFPTVPKGSGLTLAPGPPPLFMHATAFSPRETGEGGAGVLDQSADFGRSELRMLT